ncbi:flagellar biosynthesis protein [Clostridium sp. USBA 49]|uniref:EscU/YscU/HrcU family type III secretion system export apparatus switch protein n=1 Tax=Clostridium sp. USBA 49 TaxID=1881060 RepID=UPI00099B206E|nr:EscU/YscU/HrcU family type III secretion system export apparatus switch protein [Clostridium sp. USBA 49]SKA84360.1 flagellar biosynthesis protein [Clostridium sp. USBA 49]
MKNIKKAAALKYDKTYEAPIVTAAGMGHIADKIIEKAKDSKVPVIYNKEMAELLTNVDVGSEIPSELYDAVAKIIAYIIDNDKKE